MSLRQIKEIFHQFRILYKAQEQENEDWQRIHKISLPTQGVISKEEAHDNNAVCYSIGFKKEEVLINCTNGQNAKLGEDKDDGVGDLEGTGFGVGLVGMREKAFDHISHICRRRLLEAGSWVVLLCPRVRYGAPKIKEGRVG